MQEVGRQVPAAGGSSSLQASTGELEGDVVVEASAHLQDLELWAAAAL